jgi:hypothetical protein
MRDYERLWTTSESRQNTFGLRHDKWIRFVQEQDGLTLPVVPDLFDTHQNHKLATARKEQCYTRITQGCPSILVYLHL